MTVMVPYDASAPARAALWRGRQLTTALDEPLLAVTVLPDDGGYASEKCWTDATGVFDRDRIATTLRQQVTNIAPTASFQCLRVDGVPTSGDLGGALRAHALEVDATVVVIGCDEESPIVTPLTAVDTDPCVESWYDVLLVRTDGNDQDSCPPEFES
jgi:nucleotide-binding universal stress UspA family protein